MADTGGRSSLDRRLPYFRVDPVDGLGSGNEANSRVRKRACWTSMQSNSTAANASIMFRGVLAGSVSHLDHGSVCTWTHSRNPFYVASGRFAYR